MRGGILGMGARRSRTDVDANNLNSRYSNLIRKELNSINGGSIYQLGGVRVLIRGCPFTASLFLID